MEVNMDIKEAMLERHMVRKYTDKPIPESVVEKLNERVSRNNSANNLCVKLMTNDSNALSAIIKFILAKGVKNYFILAGDADADLEEKLGYVAADLMLYAQTLGLNTWYVGGTFNRRVAKYVESKKVVGIVAVGYGEKQGAPHKSKAAKDVSSVDDETPEWFINGVEASLLAPTALNKQDYIITRDGNKVKIENENGVFTAVNRGLIKYHFELGAGKENFEWMS